MRDYLYQTLEIKSGSIEKAPNQIFLDILKTQNIIENKRVNFFSQPRPSASILGVLNIFKAPTFLEKHRPAKNANDLLDLEGELGGSLFNQSIPDASYKQFFYNNGSWFLHVSDKNREETTRFTIRENDALKIINNGQQEERMTAEEIKNLFTAVKLYDEVIDNKIYNPIPGQEYDLAA